MPEALPDPACGLGYTETQVQSFLGELWPDFVTWTFSKTTGLCEGSEGCTQPHGRAFYPVDVRRFVDQQAASQL